MARLTIRKIRQSAKADQGKEKRKKVSEIMSKEAYYMKCGNHTSSADI
jgi:hypothetical protein